MLLFLVRTEVSARVSVSYKALREWGPLNYTCQLYFTNGTGWPTENNNSV